jgi:hypothetical protein
LDAVYLRAAQAYMLISMPTGTSTIFGVFQVIPSSEVVWRDLHADVEPRSTQDVAQVRKIDARTSIFLSWTNRLPSWTTRSRLDDIDRHMQPNIRTAAYRTQRQIPNRENDRRSARTGRRNTAA